jgi:hypothetical protein
MNALLGRKQHGRELSDELDSHLQAHVDDNLRAGMSDEEARRHACVGGNRTVRRIGICREQRTREMSIRMAVGASPGDVLALITGRG